MGRCSDSAGRWTLCDLISLASNLAAAVALHVAHYNFCRRHSTLRMTPAMAANVTGTVWSLEDLYERVMGR
jgi:hypothetical protein